MQWGFHLDLTWSSGPIKIHHITVGSLPYILAKAARDNVTIRNLYTQGYPKENPQRIQTLLRPINYLSPNV